MTISARSGRRHTPASWVLASTCACLVLTQLSACKAADSKQVYRIGLGPWVGFGPLYLARDKGFFKEAGIEVELIVLTGISERNAALKGSRIDALAAPVDYFVLSAGNRVDATVVMAIDESVGGDGIVARKGITRFEDLRGRRVAFQRGLPSEFFLRALLRQHGVGLDELKHSDMETAQGGAAFIAGQLDAAVLWEPWLTRATEQGGGHVLASTRDYPDLIVDCLGFTKEAVKRSPQDVGKIVKAILRAIDYAKQNPGDANRVMSPYFQLDPAKYAAVLSGARFTDLARNQEYFGSARTPGRIFDVARRASDVWLEANAIKQPVTAEAVISTNFVSGTGG